MNLPPYEFSQYRAIQKNLANPNTDETRNPAYNLLIL